MPIPKKNQLVGLDIGSHSIKLVEIDDTKKVDKESKKNNTIQQDIYEKQDNILTNPDLV